MLIHWNSYPLKVLAKVSKIHANHYMRNCHSQQHGEIPTSSSKCLTSNIIHLCELIKSCSCHQELDQAQCPAKELDAEISKRYSLACIIFVVVSIIFFHDPNPEVHLHGISAVSEQSYALAFLFLPGWHYSSVMGSSNYNASTAGLKDCHTLY